MDMLFFIASTVLIVVIAFFAYKQHPLAYDELLSLWAFSCAIGLAEFLWGYWSGYWDLHVSSIGRFFTVIITWCFAFPACNIAMVCLLRRSWIWNVVLVTAFTVFKTVQEYISVYLINIGNYDKGWHIGLTFLSYYLPLLVVWGFYRLLIFLKRLPE